MKEEQPSIQLCKEDADFVISAFLEMNGKPLDSLSRLSFAPNIVAAYDYMVASFEDNKQKFFESMMTVVEECNQLAVYDCETVSKTAKESVARIGAESMIPVVDDFFKGGDYTESLVEVMIMYTVENMKVANDARESSKLN